MINFGNVVNYLVAHANVHQNLHKRVSETVKGKKRLLCLLGLHLDSDNRVLGGVSGPKGELDFEILSNGNLDVNYSTFSASDELIVRARIITAINQVARNGFPTTFFPAKRTKGEFYLMRDGNPSFTFSAKNAIDANQITNRFVNKMMTFKLKVIRASK